MWVEVSVVVNTCEFANLDDRVQPTSHVVVAVVVVAVVVVIFARN